MKIVAMIPARLGSQRLKQKNLLEINNKTLVRICVDKCLDSEVFTDVYLNSESDLILKQATKGCKIYKRDKEIANNSATSEHFIRDFLSKVDCDYLFQVHSIAPLLKIDEIKDFVNSFIQSEKQVGLSYEKIILETLSEGEPVNFSFERKQNSQDLKTLKKINWSITGWKNNKSLLEEKCLSFGSTRYYHEVSKLSGFVIKTEEDYLVCKAILENQ